MFVAFSLLELALFLVFVLAMTLSTLSDRRGYPSTKWFVGAFFFAVLWFMYDMSAFLSWAYVSSFEWVVPSLQYLGVGFAYAIIEFIINVRGISISARKEWLKFVESNYQKSSTGLTSQEIKDRDKLMDFVSNNRIYGETWAANKHYPLIKFTADKCKNTIVAKIDRQETCKRVIDWMLFWPFFGISLIFGRLLTAIIKNITSGIAYVGDKFVNAWFKDVFKV